jgi:uncharacterized SAM-binding protein YcdF (DUF218 family)
MKSRVKCPACQSDSVIQNESGRKGTKTFYCLTCETSFAAQSVLRPPKIVAGIVVAALVIVPFVLHWPMRLLLKGVSPPQDQPIDTIVVLGRGPKSQGSRALAAAQLWQDNQTANIFVSGMTDAPEIMQLLAEMGVPKTQIKGERCSQSTWENGLFSALLLNPDASQRILLVTDAPHLLRATWVFNSFGFEEVVPYPTEPNLDALFSVNRFNLLLREYAALIAYQISGKYQPQSPTEKQILGNRSKSQGK